MIYFLRAGEAGHVKIGWTKDEKSLVVRRSMLQCGQPFPLIVIRTMDAPRWAETWLHGFFSGIRASGEWFDFKPEMLTIEHPRNRPRAKRSSSGNISSRTKLTTIRLPLDLVAFAQARLKPAGSLSGVIVCTLRGAWDCPEPTSTAPAVPREDGT